MDYSIFDIETNGLIETVDKFHCLSVNQFRNGVSTKFSLTDTEQIKQFFLTEQTLIGHNIVRYDNPVAEKLLGIKIDARFIDTLWVSFYLFPRRDSHNLEDWGEDVGIGKPKILDWDNLPVEDYIYRCSQDVEINTRVWDIMLPYLLELYGDGAGVKRILGYLSFKADCAREMEEMKWRLDTVKCKENLDFLVEEKAKKIELLKQVMPLNKKYVLKVKPKNPYKKDGSLSVHGQNWVNLCVANGLPEYHNGSIKIVDKTEVGNPNSHAQLKAWLFDIGWIPQTFDYKRPKDAHGNTDYNAAMRQIPQLQNEDKSGICSSIKKLYPIAPNLIHLEDYFVLQHRIGILTGFMEKVDDNGFLKAFTHGLTNTLRFQHAKPLVNLPTIPKKHWELIRGVLIAPSENHVLCGSDMSGLEDNTKRHYMYFYDPKYVDEMREYGFDAHTDIAVTAAKMSKDEECFYKWYVAKKEGKNYEKVLSIYQSKDYSIDQRRKHNVTGITLEEILAKGDEDQAKIIKVLKPIRLKTKKVNFACVYGAGPPKLVLTANISLKEAQLLHKGYWKRNWAVKRIAEDCIVKTVKGQMWLFNPVSGFWISLRTLKDRFSSLNQSTGVYCFDTWVRKVRSKGVKICGQFHDEIIFPLLKGTEEEHKLKLKQAIEEVNQELQLNVPLGISIDMGNTYADIH